MTSDEEGESSAPPSRRTGKVGDPSGCTPSSASDSKVYQTHPSWTADGRFILMSSTRSGTAELYALEEATGDMVQDKLLTQGHIPNPTKPHPRPSIGPDGCRVLFV